MNISPLICPRNVTRVGQFILELDVAAISEHCYYDSASAFQQLKVSLEQYAQPADRLDIDRLETQLRALISCVKECVSLLTQEARQQLSHYLHWYEGCSDKKHYAKETAYTFSSKASRAEIVLRR